jgi:uncharacterized protein
MISYNVAQLLKDAVGAHRDYDFDEPSLELSEDMTAIDLSGHVRLTRLNKSILCQGQVVATVTLQCRRCLEEYATEVATDFEDRYYPTVDVISGHPIEFGDEAANGEEEVDALRIDANHGLDLGELLRQVIILAPPIMPVCREDCPGLPAPRGVQVHLGNQVDEEADEEDAPIDIRLAALAQLLEDDQATGIPFSKN